MNISSRLIAAALIVVAPGCLITETQDMGPDPYTPPEQEPGPELVEEVSTGQCGAVAVSKEGGRAPGGVGMHAIAVAPNSDVVMAGFYKGEGMLGGELLPEGYPAVGVVRNDARGEHIWSRGFDASGGPGAWASAVAVDSAGDVVLVGAYTGNIDFGGGQLPARGLCLPWCTPDGFITKLDANGEHVFSTSFGDRFGTLTISLSNLSASVQGDGATSVAIDRDDNIIVVGMFRGLIDDFGGDDLVGSEDANNVFVLKLDPSGAHLFSRRLGSPGAGASSVTVDAAGDIYIAGHYRGEMQFAEGETLTTIESAGNAFVAKLDGGDGTLTWARDTTLVDGHASSRGLAATNDGVVALLSFGGQVELAGAAYETDSNSIEGAIVSHISAAGEVRWSKAFQTTTNEDLSARGLAVDPDGGIHATGYTGGPVDFGGGLFGGARSMLFTVELDAAGEHVCSRRAHGQEHSYGFAVAASAERVWLAGGYDAAVDVGGGELTASDDEFHSLLAAFAR